MDDDPYIQDQHDETFEAGDYTLDHVTPILTAAFMDVPAGGALGTALRASPTTSMEPEEQVLVACMVEDIQQIELTSEEQMVECVSACITRLRYDVALVATVGSRKTTDGSRNCCGFLALYQAYRACKGASYQEVVALGQRACPTAVTHKKLAGFLRKMLGLLDATCELRTDLEGAAEWLDPRNEGRVLPLTLRASTTLFCFPGFNPGFGITLFAFDEEAS